jgi:5'-3' exoribonuclease 1
MNSILHNCSHSNDGEISRLKDEQIFGAIFAYIDYLFNLIKPKKVFYMAIDGVAPRAKMNQQRARRFRSAVEAEEMMKKAIQSGEPIPKDPAFDTNAITPGTEFMAKVTENLKFYINQKVSNDRRWQDIEIILSGHEVPGEGEHKIMEYIRVQKAQPEYNANTRHCVYGLDADLIMLGLVAHEPHFSLLREEVTFGRNKKTSTDLTNQTFFLLHISLVRDYLEEEFQSLSDDISFEYDFERVLDDFVLILYVIGNDFLPNLPDLHLNKGAFPLLLHTFKEAMRRTDGYLNENGKINLKRLSIWLDILSIFELENFEEGDIDVEWFNKQLDNVSRRGERKRERQGKELLLKQQKKIVGMIGTWILKVYHGAFNIKEYHQDDSKIPELELPSDFFESELNLEFMKKFAYDLGLFIVHNNSTNKYTAKLDIDGINPDETTEEFNQRLVDIKQTLRKYQSSVVVEDEKTLRSEEDLYNEKFEIWKDKYYKEKLHFSIHDEEELVKITENYIEGLQWVLNYYYSGICSWPWYYRYHYAPRISDLSNGLNVKLEFEMGKPFTPFEQLMSVLPERSKELIPVCYRHLMTDEDSPIKDFYPADCEIDKNGKTASWEAVVLLSFVDEKRLKAAMAPLSSKLSIEEKKRNSFGFNLIYNFNPQVSTLVKSPLPSAFPDFESHATESVYHLPSMEGKKFIIGLSKGVKTGIYMLSGFPTLQTIPHTSKLQADQLVVFQQPTRSESMILTLENEFENINPEQFAHLYCNKIVFAGWPYLKEYIVLYVTDSLMRYEVLKNHGSKVVSSPLENFEISEFEKNVEDINIYMHKKKGLRFTTGDISEEIIAGNENGTKNKKSLEFSNEPIDGLVYAKRVVGVTPNSSGKLVKVFSDKIECFPIQLIVPKIENLDPRFEEKEPVPLSEEYPKGTPIIFLGKAAYGTPAVVVGTDKNTLAIQFNKQETPEPLFGLDAAKVEHESIIYHPAFEAANILGINTYVLSKITSTYMIFDAGDRKVNIGLSLKFEGKGIKTLGYTRKNGRYWEYSDLAINLIKEYLKNFSELINALVHYKGNNIPKAIELFANKSEEEVSQLVRDVKDYILNKKESLSQVSLRSDSLSKFSIGKIEKQIIEYSQVAKPVKTFNIKNIPRYAVLNPAVPVLKLKQQQFRLGDRVLYVLDSGKVPLFSKGTVVGFRSSETAVSVHVVFDSPILTGNSFDGRLKTQRGLSLDSSSLLNITLKQFLYIPKPANGVVSNDKKAASEKVKLELKKKTETRISHEKAKKEEEKRVAKLMEQSKKELLTIINNEKKPIKQTTATTTTKTASSETHIGIATNKAELPAANTNNGDAKKLLNMLVNNVLTPASGDATKSTTSRPQIDMRPVSLPYANNFTSAPFNPFPMPMMPTNPMYPYMPQMPMVGPAGIPMNIPPLNGPPVQIDTESSKQVLEALKSVGIDTNGTKAVNQVKEASTTMPNLNSNQRGGHRGRGNKNNRGYRDNTRGRGNFRGSSKPDHKNASVEV